MISRLTPAFAIALAVGLLASCGKESNVVARQVVAKVNAEEITVQQLHADLARFQGLNDRQRKYVTGELLAQRVDQVLLAQRAMERKLDQDPRVAHAIETSTRQILAQAYLDSITTQASRPSPEEVGNFYARHPELFAERKIFRLQELAIASHPGLTAARVEQEIRNAKSLDEVYEWLKQEGFTFSANSTVKAAEQLPMDILPRLTGLKQGQAMQVPAQHGYLIVQVAAAELFPLTEEQVRKPIEQYLTGLKRRELAQAEVRTLRNNAQIKYAGDFAPAASAASDTAPQTAAPAVPAAAADPVLRKLAIEPSVKGI